MKDAAPRWYAQLSRLTGANAPPAGAGADATRQRLYEKWLKLDRWALRAEGIPLLFGVDPERRQEWLSDAAVRRLEEEAWAQMEAELTLDDQGGVSPAGLYQWARARGMAVPDDFDRLLQFILSTVRGATVSTPEAAGIPAQHGAGEREQVVGAALNILSKWPERCRDEHGFVDAERIVAIIESQPAMWFDKPRSPLSKQAMVAILARWLE